MNIGKLLDGIFRLNPAPIYPDPQSISNNAYNQWETPVNTPTVTGVNNQYLYQYGTAQQATAARNCVPNTYTISGTGTVGLGQMPNYPTATVIQPSIGMLCNVAFTDANGCVWSITIDQAFVTIMSAISQAHATRNQISQGIVGTYKPIGLGSPAPQKMVDGDFSFDEMAEAELIIQELEGGQKSEGCT